MKIAIIGAGNLGGAIAHGIHSEITFEQMILTRRNLEALSPWRDTKKVAISSDNQWAVQQSDLIVLAIQPGQLIGIADQIKDVLSPDKVIVSVITGQSIETLEGLFGSESPIIRAMPNTAIAVGESMTCLCANTAGEAHMDSAIALFESVGETLVIEERLMQSATVIGASGVAFWMRLIRATTQGGIQLGFEAEAAQKLAVQTCLGSAKLLSERQSHPEAEIDKVTTPMGCTISGLNEMEHQGLSAALIQGILSSYHKINEIKN